MKRKRETRYVMAVLLISGTLLSACSANTPELIEPVGAGYDTAVVSYGKVSDITAYYAEVLPVTEELYFSTDGTIENLAAYRGQEVKKGDLLVELDQEENLKQLDELRSQLEELETRGSYEDQLAQLDIEYMKLQRLERRWDNRGDYDLKIEAAELALNQAVELRELTKSYLNSEIERIEALTSQQLLYAPCDGTFYYDDSVSEGSRVYEYRTFAYIIDPSDLSLVVRDETIPDSVLDGGEYYGWVNGKRYELEYEPLDEGEVLSLNLAGKTVPSYFRIMDVSDITPGLTGAVISGLTRADNVLTIPSNSLFYDGGGMFVYLINEAGGREKRYVSTGASNEIVTEITEGLAEGDVVYVQE